MAKPTVDKTIGQLLDEAIQDADITQYALAKRLSEIRGTTLAAQDQAIRRIRRLGQTPTWDVAQDLARAFDPELDLPDDYFYRLRANSSVREATEKALAQVAELQRRVEVLEKALTKRTAAAPRKQGTSRRR